MMRGIKFRGKRVDNGEWVYGHYINVGAYKDDLGHRIGSPNSWDMFKVDTETVGQYIRLNDKHQKETFSGDIIQQHDSRCMVRDREGGWELEMINGRYSGSTFTISFLSSEHFEIIGNIHDNPELLEVVK